MKKFIIIFLTYAGLSLSITAQTVVKMSLPVQSKKPLQVEVLYNEEVPAGIPVVLGIMGYNVTGGVEPYTFEWVKNGQLIGTGDVIVITASKGDQFSLKATDKNRCYFTTSFSMKVIGKNVNQTVDEKNVIVISPTLITNDFISITLPNSEIVFPATIRIYKLSGEMLLQTTITKSTDMKLNLPNGTYFVSAKTDTIHKVEKIIVQH